MKSDVVTRPNRVGRVMQCVVIVAVLFFLAPIDTFKGRRTASVAEPLSQKDDSGARSAFLAAYTVFMHPRCLNCHPVSDVPLQGDGSDFHAQSVRRGASGHGKYGMKCGACHQKANLPGENMPPGVSSEWHMPPAEMRMVFEGKSPKDLCRQLKNPQLNGGRKTLEAAIEHLEADPLVLWGWRPGDGRSIPPMSHAEFVQKMRQWASNGGACPE